MRIGVLAGAGNDWRTALEKVQIAEESREKKTDIRNHVRY